MAIRRRFASVPPVFVSAKTSRSRSYEALPVRSALHLRGAPLSRADKLAYVSRADDYLSDRVTNAGYFSNYALEEGYDTARQSRNRDARLLRDATDAIVSSESFATPQTSVAARRVARGQSMAPRAASVPPRFLYPEVDFWDFPRSYAPLYRIDTQDTTTTDDYYPYYTRRPLIAYPKPWSSEALSRVMMRRSPERAMSVPPHMLFREEQQRKMQAIPLYDEWRSIARAKSVPPEMLPISRSWYLPYFERSLSPYYRRRLALSQWPRGVAPLWPLPTEGLRAHRMPRRYLAPETARSGFASLWADYDYEPGLRRRQLEEAVRYGVRPRVLASPLARASLARAWRYAATPSAPPRATMAYVKESKHGFPLLYVARKGPKQGRRLKAAIIASKMEVDSFRGRRPRSEYAARKYRAMRMADQENIYAKTPLTAGYYASHPPLPKMTERKAIRTDDGYTKPKNLLSWQYRLDSLMKPCDLMYQPSGSFGRIRQQVRAAQEGMDRHRQMLDRYLPEEGAESSDAAARVLRKMAEMDKRYPVAEGGAPERQRATVKIPNYYAYGVDPANPPVSDLRRRIRKTLNKTRRS